MVMAEPTVRIASRGSRLALWQAEAVRSGMLAHRPELSVEIQIVRTIGDRVLDVPLARIGDRGLFTKEVDEALLSGQADVAVHSLKDIPTRIPDGLRLAAVSLREDPRDVLVPRTGVASTLKELPPGSRVGTSSLRRRSQIRRLRPDLTVLDLRGNLDTRLSKLDSGEYEAIVLAAAGIVRLGLAERIGESLDPEWWLPAVGQGALGIVTRAGDESTASFLAPLNDPTTAACVQAERGFLRSLEGGCQVPIGALATISGEWLTIDGFVSDLDGERFLRASLRGRVDDAEALGEALAADLVSRGAADVLDRVRQESGLPPVSPP